MYVYSKDNATSEINKWQGYEIREGVNLTSIEKRKNTNIVTRVIPYGYDNLVISSVNSGLLYLDDNSYSPKVYAKIIHNPDIHTPHALKVWAQKELAKMCRPTFQYEVGFTWRQDEDYAHETFALYDIVRVVYHDKEIGQEVTDNQRIISLEYDVWKKSAFNGVLGSKPRWVQNLKQSVVNGIKVGQVLSSSGTISTGSIYYGSGENKKRLSSFLGGVESTIAQIEATADEDRANVELISLYTNAAKGVKTVQEYTPETWDTAYIYYVSQGLNTGYWKWEVSEWVKTQPMNSTLATVNATASRAAANVELLAKYTSSVDEIIEVENTSEQGTWDTNAIYYVSSTDKFYKYSGSSWGIVDQMSTMVASISAKSSENESKISLVVEKVDGVDVINAASIVAAINDAGSTITIDADKINFDGFATFMRGADYLTAGQTTIDGGRITANSITASQINATDLSVSAANISGTLTAEQIDTSGLVAESIVVKNEEETKTLFSANSATNTVFIDGTVIAGVLASSNFAYTSGNYSSAGTAFNLTNGAIITPQFAIDSSGNAYFTGVITATGGKIGGTSGWNIGTGALYSGVVSMSDTTHDGVYLGIDGIRSSYFNPATSTRYITDIKNGQIVNSIIDDTYISSGMLSTNHLVLSYSDSMQPEVMFDIINAGYYLNMTFHNLRISMSGNSGTLRGIWTVWGELISSGDLKVEDGVLSIPGYPSVKTALDSFRDRLDALDGGCGVCQSGQCGSCDTCQGCNYCDSCQLCDTCQSCDTCDTCQTCQSGDTPEYDYYVGDIFKVYFDQDGSLYLDLDGFEIDEYDSDGVYLRCVREGWCSYQLMASGEPAGELVELYIGPSGCGSCDSYWDGNDWVN